MLSDMDRWWQMHVLHRQDPRLLLGERNDQHSKSDSNYIWALRDISFSLEQGTILTVIGHNGSGKSTMLKLLSRLTTPTTGEIRYEGKITSMLEVGTGFHPDFTGRENVYMNGAIMGMRRSEIQRRFDDIVNFAGVERFIDTPVKHYSSGMAMRLGFAVSAFLEPTILLIDEVFAVGDIEFQAKALGKLDEMVRQNGTTIIAVTHDMNAVEMLSTRTLVLNAGRLIYDGTPARAIEIFKQGLDTYVDTAGMSIK